MSLHGAPPLSRRRWHNPSPLHPRAHCSFCLPPGLLHPEAVFKELKEKRNELEKVSSSPGTTWGRPQRRLAQGGHPTLDPDPSFPRQLGIVNVTYLNQEMEEEVKDQFSTPLIITIITLACSLLLVAAIYGCCHQRFSQKKNQVRWEEGWDGHPETPPCPRGTSRRRGAHELPLCWWRPPCWCRSRGCRAKSQSRVPERHGCFWDGDQGNEGLEVQGYGHEQHPSAAPRAAEQRPQVRA